MGLWEYVVLFLAVTASWAGVPAIGSAAAGAAAVGASQGNLNLGVVIAIAIVAGEVGGLTGYRIGDRWGRQLVERPGKRQARRRELLDKGERAYAKWGRFAVFVTPAVISGTARMDYRQFAVWNGVASVAFSLGVTLTSFGIGRVSSGHHSARDLAILVCGFAVCAGLASLAVHRHRRYKVTAETH